MTIYSPGGLIGDPLPLPLSQYQKNPLLPLPLYQAKDCTYLVCAATFRLKISPNNLSNHFY